MKTVEVGIECSACGASLMISPSVDMYSKKVTYQVKPCLKCADKTYVSGYEDSDKNAQRSLPNDEEDGQDRYIEL